MSQTYSSIVSLGGNCEVAHQIRRRFETDRAFPFDWWITPLAAVPLLLRTGPDTLFDPTRLDAGPHRHAVKCLTTGILHHHDFSRDAEGLVVAELLQEQLPQLKNKYAALWSRLDAACGEGQRVLFVRSWCAILHYPDSAPRHDHHGEYAFADLMTAIENRYPKLDFHILFLNYGFRVLEDPRARFWDIDYSREACDWRGSNIGWNDAFAGIELAPASSPFLQLA